MLAVERLGQGPPVLFVHGDIVGPDLTWRKQRELAERWSIAIPSRPGFGESPAIERNDFEVEAPMFAELLGDGAHLVGHSYGAVIALLAAAQRPEAVRSLTVSEPGSLRLAAGDPDVDQVIAHGEELYRHARDMEPRDFLLMFRSGLHSAHETPPDLPEWLERGARHVMHERPPWEADIPLDALAAARFPKLVISGGHSPAFEAICDVLAERTGAERALITGRGHTIPATGEAYNACLREFLRGEG